MGETILALSALTMNLLTILVGVKYARRSSESSKEVSGDVYDLRERVEKAEKAVKECEMDRLQLKMENYELMRKLTGTP